MKKHLQWVIRPITVMAAIFGLALIEYPEGKLRRFLSLLCTIVSCSLQLAMLIAKFILLDVKDAVFPWWISCTILGYVSLQILVMGCLSQLHGKRHQQCAEAMNEIDQTLKGLGIETDYSRFRRVVVVRLVVWMTCASVLNAVGSLAMSEDTNQIYGPIAIFIMNIPSYFRFIINIYFWFLVRYAGTRFDCMNSALRELALDDNDYIGWVRNKKVTSIRGVYILNEKNKRIIWTIMHLHFRLCNILCDITRLFEIQLYMDIGFGFQYLLLNMILMFRLILSPFEDNKYKYFALFLTWSIIHILEIFGTNYVCENVGSKAITLSDIAVRLICEMDDEKMREDLLLIGLQTKHKPLRFSCLGLDYFGYQFFYAIVSMIAAMTVIILQLGTGLE